MFELIVNIIMVVALVFTFFFHVLEAPVPLKVQKNPYALQPDIWPKAIIILLLICFAFNIYKIIKNNKGKENFTFSAFASTIPGFFKSKIFVGIVIVTFAALILEYVGFMVTALFVLGAYGFLLGERNILRLIIVSVLITLALYIVFSVLLAVNLPRGVGVFRNFALLIESIF